MNLRDLTAAVSVLLLGIAGLAHAQTPTPAERASAATYQRVPAEQAAELKVGNRPIVTFRSQFLSRVPSIGLQDGGQVHGLFSAQANTADYGLGSNLNTSYAGSRVGVTGAFAARRIGDIRVGCGVDSHAAVTRFLGVRSDVLMPDRLPETGFRQYGAQATVNWLPGSNHHVLASYRRGYQDRGQRYDQLLGGDGNLVADLRDLTLDLFFARYERIGAGWFDEASITGSEDFVDAVTSTASTPRPWVRSRTTAVVASRRSTRPRPPARVTIAVVHSRRSIPMRLTGTTRKR